MLNNKSKVLFLNFKVEIKFLLSDYYVLDTLQETGYSSAQKDKGCYMFLWGADTTLKMHI